MPLTASWAYPELHERVEELRELNKTQFMSETKAQQTDERLPV